MTPERRKKIEKILNHRQNDLTIILENVFDPHNVSAVLRTCEAVGIMEVFLVNTMKPNHHRFEFYAAASATKWLIIHRFDNLQECIKEVRTRYQHLWCTHLSQDAKSLYQLPLTQPTALVFGNEKNGISAEMLNLCDGNFVIPQVGIIQSLNISVACAVSVYEAYRQKESAGHYQTKKISDQNELQLLKQWGEERLKDF